ncbi:MAG: DUF3501 family protein [Nannocystaceae bacterium]
MERSSAARPCASSDPRALWTPTTSPPRLRPEALLAEGAYLELRRREGAALAALRARRRLRVTPALTLLFEGHETVLTQIYEQLRVEGWSPARARRELDTYACLVPDRGRLCVTAMIDGGDRAHAVALLAALRAGGLRLRCAALRCVAAPFDADDDDPVQYLRVAAPPELAAALAADAPAHLELDAVGICARVPLPAPLRRELVCDLRGGPASTPLLRGADAQRIITHPKGRHDVHTRHQTRP